MQKCHGLLQHLPFETNLGVAADKCIEHAFEALGIGLRLGKIESERVASKERVFQRLEQFLDVAVFHALESRERQSRLVADGQKDDGFVGRRRGS